MGPCWSEKFKTLFLTKSAWDPIGVKKIKKKTVLDSFQSISTRFYAEYPYNGGIFAVKFLADLPTIKKNYGSWNLVLTQDQIGLDLQFSSEFNQTSQYVLW